MKDERILKKSGRKIHISRICHEINPLRGAQVNIRLKVRSNDDDEEEEKLKMKMKHQLNVYFLVIIFTAHVCY